MSRLSLLLLLCLPKLLLLTSCCGHTSAPGGLRRVESKFLRTAFGCRELPPRRIVTAVVFHPRQASLDSEIFFTATARLRSAVVGGMDVRKAFIRSARHREANEVPPRAREGRGLLVLLETFPGKNVPAFHGMDRERTTLSGRRW